MDCVVLDSTALYPRGGGLVSDVGVMKSDVGESRVVEVVFGDDGVIHRVEGRAPTSGSVIECVLDWDRRYRLMRMHTGLHVLAATMVEMAKTIITGNNVSHDSGAKLVVTDVLLIQTVEYGKIHACCGCRIKWLDCNLLDLNLDEWMFYNWAVLR